MYTRSAAVSPSVLPLSVDAAGALARIEDGEPPLGSDPRRDALPAADVPCFPLAADAWPPPAPVAPPAVAPPPAAAPAPPLAAAPLATDSVPPAGAPLALVPWPPEPPPDDPTTTAEPRLALLPWPGPPKPLSS